MMKIPDNQIDQIRNSANIVQIIGGYVRLKQEGNNFVGLCPYHEEKTPSFKVRQDKQFYKCFGCNEGGDVFEFLIKHQGMTFFDAIRLVADRVGIQLSTDKRQVSHSNGKPEATFDYTDQSGKLIYQVVRFANKQFRQCRPGVNGKPIWDLDGVESTIYHLPAVIKAILAKHYIVIVEGEKDCYALEKIKIVATTNSGGAGKWRDYYNKYLSGANVVILPDNDPPGKAHAEQVAQSLYKTVKSIRVLSLPDLKHKEDISDWLNQGGTRKQLIELVKKCNVWEPEDVSAGDDNGKLVPENMDKPAAMEIIGSDRWLAYFLKKHYGEDVRYNFNSKQWHIWDKKMWTPDITNQIMRIGEKTIDKLWDKHRKMPHFIDNVQNKQREQVRKLAVKSESLKGITNFLTYAQSLEGIAVTESDFDKNPNLFNLKNGTFDLESDTFYEHKKADNLSKTSGVEYDENAEAPAWIEALNLWFGNDTELIDFVKVALGLSLSGNISEELFLFAHGPGRNGKTVFLKTIQLIFGDYFLQAPTELVTLSKFESSSNYSLPHLSGKRVVCVSEFGRRHVFNSSLLKKLCGGDPLTARPIYGDFFTFLPSHTLWLFSNFAPAADGSDRAFWRRCHKIPFDISIPLALRKTQVEMLAKFRDESAGILNFCIDGYRIYKDRGLIVPVSVKTATQEYQTDSDVVGQFKEEHILVTMGARTTVQEVYGRYVDWAKAVNEFVFKRRTFNKMLIEHGFEPPESGTGNKFFWKDITLSKVT